MFAQLTVSISFADKEVVSMFANQRFRSIVFRTVLVLMTALAASTVHNLGLIASLFGSVAYTIYGQHYTDTIIRNLFIREY